MTSAFRTLVRATSRLRPTRLRTIPTRPFDPVWQRRTCLVSATGHATGTATLHDTRPDLTIRSRRCATPRAASSGCCASSVTRYHRRQRHQRNTAPGTHRTAVTQLGKVRHAHDSDQRDRPCAPKQGCRTSVRIAVARRRLSRTLGSPSSLAPMYIRPEALSQNPSSLYPTSYGFNCVSHSVSLRRAQVPKTFRAW